MNEYFQENRRALFLLTILLLLLAIVLYIVLLHPLLNDLKREEKNVSSLENDIDLLQKEIDNRDVDLSEIDVDRLLLERKIPHERDLDQYILSLQQLEFETNSQIEEIEFVYDSNINVEMIEEENEIAESTVDDVAEEIDEEAKGEEGEAETDEELVVDEQILLEKPENLHIIVVRVNAISPSYDDFIALIKEIEKRERISIVTQLQFNQATEEDEYFSDEDIDLIPFSVELTTFYFTD